MGTCADESLDATFGLCSSASLFYWLPNLLLESAQLRISQGLDQDACATGECAVKLLQVGSRKTGGPALAESMESKSRGFGPGPCKAKSVMNQMMQRCSGLHQEACASDGACTWEEFGGDSQKYGWGPAPCRALGNDEVIIQQCSSKGLLACKSDLACLWNPWASGGGHQGHQLGGRGQWAAGEDFKCQGKLLNILGAMDARLEFDSVFSLFYA